MSPIVARLDRLIHLLMVLLWIRLRMLWCALRIRGLGLRIRARRWALLALAALVGLLDRAIQRLPRRADGKPHVSADREDR